jgi:hypothetical protein
LPAPKGAWGIDKIDKQTVTTAPTKHKNKAKKSPVLRLATWNVRTMCPGIASDLQLTTDNRKTAIINNELARLKIDIAAL